MSLSVKSLSVSLSGREILRDVTFDLPENGMYFLLGPNGAGKTTLLKTLRGIILPKSGDIIWSEKLLNEYSSKELAAEIGYLPQNVPPTDMTVLTFVMLGSAPYLKWGSVPGTKYREAAFSALKSLRIDDLAHRSMDKISGGQRQLAMLAQSMVQNPKLLLMDEPTANLDVKRQQDFLKMMRAHVNKNEKCALLSVHDPNIALAYGDGALILKDKSVIFLKSSESFGEELCGLLRPIYGENLALSSEGFCYWKNERGL